MNLPKLTAILESITSLLVEEITYLDIGHYSKNESGKEEAWVMINDDIVTSTEAYRKFPDFSKYTTPELASNNLHDWAQNGGIKTPSVIGRIDHHKKRISITPKFHQKAEYAKRLLEMDYPDYRIYMFN